LKFQVPCTRFQARPLPLAAKGVGGGKTSVLFAAGVNRFTPEHQDPITQHSRQNHGVLPHKNRFPAMPRESRRASFERARKIANSMSFGTPPDRDHLRLPAEADRKDDKTDELWNMESSLQARSNTSTSGKYLVIAPVTSHESPFTSPSLTPET
jgi:hypothetical protein